MVSCLTTESYYFTKHPRILGHTNDADGELRNI